MSATKILSVLLYLVFYNYVCAVEIVDLVIRNEKIGNKTNEKFLSVALDSIVIAEKFRHFDMRDERLLNLSSYLAPAYLRIGGNLADRLNFSPKDPTDETVIDRQILENCFYKGKQYCSKDFTNFTMTGSEWKQLNDFAKKVGFTIVFDLNCLIRKKDGSWDPKNAEELIEFSDKHAFNLHWQLGNEPDAFKHKFNSTVNATQLAKDFSALQTILDKFPRYKKSLVIGPDVTRPRPNHKASAEYLEKFLNSSKKHVVDVVSWHQYYLNGREAHLDDFLKPETFELLENQIKMVKGIVNETGYNNTPIWLGETSSAYGGGAPGLSDAFVASFLWLDKLGLAAKYGLQTVVRQSLFKGYYALIDEEYQPAPDWWISVFYKRMVDPEALNCSVAGVSKTVRLYCHCTKPPSKVSDLQKSAVTVFGVNINSESAQVNLKGLSSHSSVAFAYIFTAEDLKSKNVRLNGQILKLSKDGKLPFYKPEVLTIDSPLLMPKYSIVFWIVPTDNICKEVKVPISVVQV